MRAAAPCVCFASVFPSGMTARDVTGGSNEARVSLATKKPGRASSSEATNVQAETFTTMIGRGHASKGIRTVVRFRCGSQPTAPARLLSIALRHRTSRRQAAMRVRPEFFRVGATVAFKQTSALRNIPCSPRVTESLDLLEIGQRRERGWKRRWFRSLPLYSRSARCSSIRRTSRPPSIPRKDQAVVSMLRQGCAHMRRAFEIEDLNLDDLVATAMDDPEAGSAKFEGVSFAEIHDAYKDDMQGRDGQPAGRPCRGHRVP